MLILRAFVPFLSSGTISRVRGAGGKFGDHGRSVRATNTSGMAGIC